MVAILTRSLEFKELVDPTVSVYEITPQTVTAHREEIVIFDFGEIFDRAARGWSSIEQLEFKSRNRPVNSMKLLPEL